MREHNPLISSEEADIQEIIEILDRIAENYGTDEEAYRAWVEATEQEEQQDRGLAFLEFLRNGLPEEAAKEEGDFFSLLMEGQGRRVAER
jgi:hypothetical protein